MRHLGRMVRHSPVGAILVATIVASILIVSIAVGCAPATPSAAPTAAAPTAPAAAAPTTAPAAQLTPAPAAAPAKAPSGTPVRLGIVTGTSGVSAALGQDQVRGGQLAVKQINAAGGILGRPLEILVRDDKFNAQEAATQANNLVVNDRVDALAGCVSGAATLATNEVAKRANMVYLSTCDSNQLNKKPDMGPYTFHLAPSPWQKIQMAMPWVVQNLGKKIFVVVADYAWGNEHLDSLQRWLQDNKLEAAGVVKAPLGTTDFSSLFPQIQAAKPEVLLAINVGADQAAFLKQAHSFGILNQMKVFQPVADLPFDQANGFENIDGTYALMNFSWELKDKVPSTKAFVDAFVQEYGNPPSGYAAYLYQALRLYADAANKAGSLDSAKVTAALAGMNFDYGSGKSFIRQCDHQLFQPFHIGKGRSQAAASSVQPWSQLAFREIVQTIAPDEKYERSCAELGAN